MNRLIISGTNWQRVKTHLLASNSERFAFLYCGFSERKDGVSLMVKDLVLVPDDEVEIDDGFKVKVSTIVRIANRARKEGLALVECHSHLFGGFGVTFSSTDRDGFAEFVPYILKDLPKRPYAALVLAKDSIDGLCWRGLDQKTEHLEEVVVLGANLTRLATTSILKQAKSRPRPPQTRDNPNLRTSRQVLAIGVIGQRLVEATTVAVVGLGGLGSHVAQQLSYLGVRNLLLIDGDKVDPTSLNRMVLAGPADVGRPKVDVIAEKLSNITEPKTVSVTTLATDLRDPRALTALKGVDIIFGCVDNDGSRLVLNEVACAYDIPCFDLAVGVNLDGGRIVEGGGRVAVVLPGNPCLLCCKEVDIAQAANDLVSPEELARKRMQGYAGPELPSPSVVSLNGTIASLGVQEFLFFVTGLRPVRLFTVYDMLEHENSPVVSRRVGPDIDCLACANRGIGDRAWIERYSSGVHGRGSRPGGDCY